MCSRSVAMRFKAVLSRTTCRRGQKKKRKKKAP